jgi:4-phytase/acid phosphatase
MCDMKIHWLQLLSLGLLCTPFVKAQPADDTQLKQVIIFGRHGIRTPILPNSFLNDFSAQMYPTFPPAPGAPPLGIAVLTPTGAADETILGGYFRLWLTNQGLLTGNDAADANFVYFRANGTPLIVGTAQAFAAGMLPAATVTVNAYPQSENDPLFNPVAAGTALFDYPKALAAVNGRLGNNPQALSSAYAPELALTRSVLLNYPVSQTPAPVAPAGTTDVTSLPISTSVGNSTLPVSIAGLSDVIEAIDPFLMEYTDGLPLAQVGWGQLDAGSISQINRLYDFFLNLEFRTPYLDRVQSSNLASHVLRTLVQTATGNTTPGALATPATKVVVLIASNTNIEGLAGLFQMDWLLPGYDPDVSALSGALMFELLQSQSSGEYIVRAVYVAQSLDQLRNQTPLTMDTPPASAPVFIPGCGIDTPTFDCPLGTLVRIASQVIDSHSADLVN